MRLPHEIAQTLLSQLEIKQPLGHFANLILKQYNYFTWLMNGQAMPLSIVLAYEQEIFSTNCQYKSAVNFQSSVAQNKIKTVVKK